MFLAWFQSLCNKFPSIYFYIFRFFSSSLAYCSDNRFFYAKLIHTTNLESATAVASLAAMFIDSITEHGHMCVCMQRIIEVVWKICVMCRLHIRTKHRTSARDIVRHFTIDWLMFMRCFMAYFFSSSLYPSLSRSHATVNDDEWCWLIFLLTLIF